MKKFFLLLLAFSGMIFALTDTDSDGITDEKDICPRVYARSTNGCPTLTVSSTPVSVNSCLNAQKKIGKNIVTLTPICDFANKVCPQINNIL
jgi:hypothetical protein